MVRERALFTHFCVSWLNLTKKVMKRDKRVIKRERDKRSDRETQESDRERERQKK